MYAPRRLAGVFFVYVSRHSHDHSTYIHGIRYPNRVFVGGLPRETTASDLAQFFARFGNVTESKVILNEDGTSKGYGFVTFSSSEEVKSVFGQGVIFYKRKKLNLGPAIRKQAPETPGELVVYVYNSQSNPQVSPSPPQVPPSPPQLPASPPHISPTSTHLPPSPTQFPVSHQQQCFPSLPMVPTYPEPMFIPNYHWFPTTAC